MRTYDRSHREAQARGTRSAILDAALAIVASTDDAPLSFARVAALAGVSEPTVYRHFPSREALLGAVAAHVQERFRAPRFPDSVDDLPAAAFAISAYFGEQPDLFRAALRTGPSREVREHGRKGRVERLHALLEEPTAHLGREDAVAVKALFATFLRGETLLEVTDRYGVAGDVAGDVMAWAMRALLAALRRDRRAGVGKLRSGRVRKRARELRDAKGREE